MGKDKQGYIESRVAYLETKRGVKMPGIKIILELMKSNTGWGLFCRWPTAAVQGQPFMAALLPIIQIFRQNLI